MIEALYARFEAGEQLSFYQLVALHVWATSLWRSYMASDNRSSYLTMTYGIEVTRRLELIEAALMARGTAE